MSDDAPADTDRHGGELLLRGSWFGTAVFVVAALAAFAVESLEAAFVIIACVLFGLGVVLFLLAYATAVSRSRYDAMGIGGLFFLQGSAPGRVQAHLMGSLAVQTIVAFTVASIRVFTPLAFGILVPMFGLGMAGVWGARYGRFDPRGS